MMKSVLVAFYSLIAIGGIKPVSASAAESPDVCVPMGPAIATALQEMRSALLVPGRKVDLAAMARLPMLQAARAEEAQRKEVDWANLCRYHADNGRVRKHSHPRVVFIGDSITENWAIADPSLFDGVGTVGRGIGGQTSPQLLVRFYADVIALRPKAVHIMVGTNDVASNTGPTSDEAIENNIRAMTQLAQANGIHVILASIPPAKSFPWSPATNPSPRIVALNSFIRAYARERGAVYADYYSVLSDGAGGMKAALGNDGVHPNADGYALMRPIAEAAVSDASH